MLSDDAEKALLASVDDLRAVKQFISQSLVQKSDGETYYYDNVCKQLRAKRPRYNSRKIKNTKTVERRSTHSAISLPALELLVADETPHRAL